MTRLSLALRSEIVIVLGFFIIDAQERLLRDNSERSSAIRQTERTTTRYSFWGHSFWGESTILDKGRMLRTPEPNLVAEMSGLIPSDDSTVSVSRRWQPRNFCGKQSGFKKR